MDTGSMKKGMRELSLEKNKARIGRMIYKVIRVVTHRKSFIGVYVSLMLLSKAYKLYAIDDQGFNS